jgi:hypothetical protein
LKTNYKKKLKEKYEESGSPLGVNIDNVHILQLLKDVTSNRTTALAEMRWTTSIPLATTIYPTESTHTKASPNVNLPCHGGCNKD